MKPIILLISVLFSLAAFSQKPEPVYSHARVHKSIPWYKEQALAWKSEMDKDPKNANAWYNYFRVKRNLLSCDTTDLRPRKERVSEMKALVDEMGVQIPNTYEYNYCKFAFEGNNFEYLNYLLKADELSEGRTLHIDYMVNWGELERNLERRDKYCRKWYESGDYSTGFLYYNFNVMAGLKPNAVLFTTGDNDTYPIWILQSQGIRKDITVLNFSLMFIDEYRNKVFKELGVDPWNIHYSGKNHDSNVMFQKLFEKELIQRVTANRKKYPVYVALTASERSEYLKPVEDDLYLTGLVYQYSSEPLDNMALMKRNFEQEYALDYIDKSFYTDISRDKVRSLNCNYVIPMIKLYHHYMESGDGQGAERIRKKLLIIAEGSPEEKDIKKQLAGK